MEKRNIYALLVAIDDYPIARHKLNGCENDMRAFETYLTNRFDPEKVNLHIKTLVNEEATREQVIDGFLSHLMQAKGHENGDQDVALFYYSGHGAQEPMPWEFHKTEEKKLIQSIVCYDSRLEGGNDLVNKELGYLIHKVSTQGKGNQPPEMVVIMDCCHSGSGTRSTGDSTKSRQMDTRKKNRRVDQYLGYEEKGEVFLDGQKVVDFPLGSHVLLAAAQSHETAKETAIDGTQRGVFTYSLIKALQDAKNDINYTDLMERTQTFAFNKVDDQLPQLDAVGAVKTNKPFLGGGTVRGNDVFVVEWKTDKDWQVDVGVLQGIPAEESNDFPTTLRLFPADATDVDMSKKENSLGIAHILTPSLSSSTVAMPSALESDQNTSYLAIIDKIGLQPMQVFLEGDAEGIQALKPVLTSPTFVAVTENKAKADYCVMAHNGRYSISTVTDNRPIAREAKGYTEKSATTIANDLEHISRWKTGLAFNNPQTDYTSFPLDVEIHKVIRQIGGTNKSFEEDLMPGTRHAFQHKYVHGIFEPYKFRIKITNTEPDPMYVALLYYSGRFGIQYFPITMEVKQDNHGKKTRIFNYVYQLQPNESVWAISGQPIEAKLGEEYAAAGITEGTDILKFITSTNKFDLDKFKKQGSLKLPVLDARASLDEDEDSDFYEEDDFGFFEGDWTTQEHFITTIQPLPLTPFSWNNSATLVGRVEVQQNNVVSGQASLCTAEQASRGIGKSMYPPSLSDSFEMEKLSFTKGWNTDKGLAVLELFEVKGAAEISESNPLVIKITDRIPNVANVVAIGVDEHGFQVLGKSENRLIKLSKLPKASATITEKLPDSHKIAFIRLLPKDGISLEQAFQELQDGIS